MSAPSAAMTDFEAELAAFSAEVEQLAEQTPEEIPTPAAAPVATTSASTSSKVGGVKRKADGDSHVHGVASSSGIPAAKKPHTIVAVAAAATATPIAHQQQPPQQPSSAYADVVAADRAAILARQQQQAAAAAASASSSTGSAAAGESTYATSSKSSNGGVGAAGGSSSNGGGEPQYIAGQVYNGWLAGITPDTWAPCWLPATPENIAAQGVLAQQRADAEAAQKAAEKKLTKAAKKDAAAAAAATSAAAQSTSVGGASGKADAAHHLRSAAGKVWDDPTLEDWPEHDFRIFCGDLGNDVTDQLLTSTFEKWPSFVKARVVRDKRTGKTKGFGFASFLDAEECVKAMREVDGKYVGNRPIKLRKSEWAKRDMGKEKSWTAKHNMYGNQGNKGDKNKHLY